MKVANGKYIDFSGSYADFLNYRERLKASEPVIKKQEKKEKPKPKGGTKNISKRLNVLEREITNLENEQNKLDELINKSAADANKLMELLNQKEELEMNLLEKMEEWEKLSEELEI